MEWGQKSGGPEGWGSNPEKVRREGAEGWGARRVGRRKVGCPKGGVPKMSRLFSLSRPHSCFAFRSRWVSSRRIVAAGLGPQTFQIVRLGFPGVILCKPQRPKDRQGFTTSSSSSSSFSCIGWRCFPYLLVSEWCVSPPHLGQCCQGCCLPCPPTLHQHLSTLNCWS